MTRRLLLSPLAGVSSARGASPVLRERALQGRGVMAALGSTGEHNKARLLALHGFSQDAQVFRSRIGSTRKGLKSRAEFLFVDAPHVISDVSDAVVESAGGAASGRSWWTWEGGDRPSQSTTYTGWEPSLRAIREAAAADGQPVDGLIGFSQGATAAALYLAALQQEGKPLPGFAILVGGFLPRDPSFAAAITAAKLRLPTLHIYGQSDTLVSMERSKALMAAFDEDLAEAHEHPGGHMVPTCTGEFKRILADFLDRCHFLAASK